MELQACGSPEVYKAPNVLAQLKERKKQLTESLEEIDNSIKILEKQPEIADLLTSLRRHL